MGWHTGASGPVTRGRMRYSAGRGKAMKEMDQKAPPEKARHYFDSGFN